MSSHGEHGPQASFTLPPFNYDYKADYLRDFIAIDPDDTAGIDAVFAGLVESASQCSDVMAADEMESLRRLVAVYKAYKGRG